MTQVLRQSTQIIVRIGPAVAVGDGFTPVTTLTLSGADEAELLKANTTTTTDISGATIAAITGCDGWYGVTLTTSLTDTVGPLDIMVNDDSLILPIFARFQVIEEAAYDMLYASSALGYIANAPVNVAQVSGDGTAADNLENAFDDAAGAVPWLGIIDQGTAQSATATTLVLRAATALGSDDACNGALLFAFGSTQGYWQSRIITDYTTADDTCTVDTWDVTPSGTITYKIFASAPSSTSVPIAANVTQWLGTAVATPTTAGVPEVDVTFINGAAVIGAGTSGDLWRA